jgi:hypothetical protein
MSVHNSPVVAALLHVVLDGALRCAGAVEQHIQRSAGSLDTEADLLQHSGNGTQLIMEDPEEMRPSSHGLKVTKVGSGLVQAEVGRLDRQAGREW